MSSENPQTFSKWEQYRKEQEALIAYHDSKLGGIIHRIVRRLSKWAWKSQVRAPINRMFERGIITSKAYHEAHAYADAMLAARQKGGES